MPMLPAGHLKLSDMGLCKKVDFDEMLSDGASVHRYAPTPHIPFRDFTYTTVHRYASNSLSTLNLTDSHPALMNRYRHTYPSPKDFAPLSFPV